MYDNYSEDQILTEFPILKDKYENNEISLQEYYDRLTALTAALDSIKKSKETNSNTGIARNISSNSNNTSNDGGGKGCLIAILIIAGLLLLGSCDGGSSDSRAGVDYGDHLYWNSAHQQVEYTPWK